MIKKEQVLYIVRDMQCVVVVFAFFIYLSYPKYDKEKAYVKEYVIGVDGNRGQVDISLFGDNPAYEIGANKEGYAVFKYPDKAFRQMKIDCSKGMRQLKKKINFIFSQNGTIVHMEMLDGN